MTHGATIPTLHLCVIFMSGKGNYYLIKLPFFWSFVICKSAATLMNWCRGDAGKEASEGLGVAQEEEGKMMSTDERSFKSG